MAPRNRQHASSAPVIQHRTRASARNAAMCVDGDEDAEAPPQRDDGDGCHGGLAVVHDAVPSQESATTVAAYIVARAPHGTFPTAPAAHNASIPQLLANYYSSSDNEEENHDEQEQDDEQRINSTSISPNTRRIAAENFANQLVNNCNAGSSSSSASSSVSSLAAGASAPLFANHDYEDDDGMDSLFGNDHYDNNNDDINDEDEDGADNVGVGIIANMNENDNAIVFDPLPPVLVLPQLSAFDRAMRLIGVLDDQNNEFHFNPEFNPANLYAHPHTAPLKDFGEVENTWGFIEGDGSNGHFSWGTINIRLPLHMRQANATAVTLRDNYNSPAPREIIGSLRMLLNVQLVDPAAPYISTDTLMRRMADGPHEHGVSVRNTIHLSNSIFARNFLAVLSLNIATNEYGVYRPSPPVPYSQGTPEPARHDLAQNQLLLYRFLLRTNEEATLRLFKDFEPITSVKKIISSINYLERCARGGIVTTYDGKIENKWSLFIHQFIMMQHVHPSFGWDIAREGSLFDNYRMIDGGRWTDFIALCSHHREAHEPSTLDWLGEDILV